MKPRSYLFVPGDSERKLTRAITTAADALILDLEDSVATSRKAYARDFVAAFLRKPPPELNAAVWVRVNPLSGSESLRDLAAVVAAGPDGIMLPKCEGPDDVLRLSHFLDALEVQGGVPAGQIRILPIVTETPMAAFALGDYARSRLSRLFGMTWGAEDLSAALGASTNRAPDGGWALVYGVVRSLALLAAKAADVEAIDTLHADFKDQGGLEAASKAAWAEGFTGKIAIHPDQVEIINACFMPSPADIAHAREVVAAFKAGSGAGVVSVRGRMLDLPHLKQAERTLARARHTT